MIVKVKACCTLPAVLVAVAVKALTPPVPAAGVPLTTPEVAFSVKPEGKPGSAKVGAGDPLAASVNVHAVPTVQVALAVEVKAGN